MFYSEEVKTTPIVKKSDDEKRALLNGVFNATDMVHDLIKGVIGDEILRDFNVSCDIKNKRIPAGREIVVTVTPDRLVDEEFVPQSKDAVDFHRQCRRYDIPSNWFGRHFKIGKKRCRVSAINGKAHSYPIICDEWNAHGRYRKIKMSVRDLKKYLLNG
jgi:hypothetical protein